MSATEAAARIAAALKSMQPAGNGSASRVSRASRHAAPRYRVRWPSSEAQWRITWTELDRVTLTWEP